MRNRVFIPKNVGKSIAFILACILIPAVGAVAILLALHKTIPSNPLIGFLMALGGGLCGSLAANFAISRWPWSKSAKSITELTISPSK